LQSCAANVAQQTDCEPDRVISLSLNCIARTVFSSSLVMHAVLADSFMLVTTLSAPSSFGPKELVTLYLRLLKSPAGGHEGNSNFPQKLWLVFC
jgi:hypothetical protein